jgi:K+-sensing histidine kinase KdpD
MTLAEQLATACAVLAPEGQTERRQALRELLSKIAHDAKNPLATFNMELYMLARAAEEMRAALQAGQLQGLGAQIDEVASMGENLKDAARRGLALVNAVEQAAAALRGEGT